MVENGLIDQNPITVFKTGEGKAIIGRIAETKNPLINNQPVLSIPCCT
jgi:hypothetical protein